MTATALPAVGGEPRFYYRPYHYDANFLRQYAPSNPFDAALLRGRHLAPHPAGSQAAARGESGRELADTLTDSGGAFVVDPDTPILAAGRARDFPSARIALMPHAQVLSLPLTRLSFANATDRQAFAAAAISAQAGAQVVTAPYFTFAQAGDGWHRLNLDLVADTRTAAPGRLVAAFIHAPVRALVAGEVAGAANAYARGGVELAFLRIPGFDPQHAGAVEIEAYRRALDAFAGEGVPAIADAVGRFGLVLAAAGAAGFSSGARHHRFVGENVIYEGEEMTSEPMRYDVPQRWYELDHNQARADARRGLLPSCPEATCSALAAGVGSAQLKEHMVHYFTHEVRALAAAGATSARQHLAQHPRGANAAWVNAL